MCLLDYLGKKAKSYHGFSCKWLSGSALWYFVGITMIRMWVFFIFLNMVRLLKTLFFFFFILMLWKGNKRFYYHCTERYHIQIVSFCLNKRNISFNNSFGLNRRKRATAHYVLENSIHKWFISFIRFLKRAAFHLAWLHWSELSHLLQLLENTAL